MDRICLPIIPLKDIVFFPNTSIPLTIENPIAIQIVNDSLKDSTPIGLPFISPMNLFGGPPTKTVCAIGIPTVLEEDPYHLRIIINGVGRVLLKDIVQEIPFQIFEADFIYDKEIIYNKRITLDDATIYRLYTILCNWVEINLPSKSEQNNFFKIIQSPYQVIDYLCMLLINDYTIKQHFLETESLNERIKMLDLLLKENDPFNEDFMTANTIKNYKTIEIDAKISQ